MTIYGLDEAGRGPVLGSMFIGVVAVESQDIIDSDVDDSKKLSQKKRQKLLDEHNKVNKTYVEVTANEIDSDTNLSTITIQTMSQALTKIGLTKPLTDEDLVIADACLSDEQKFVTQLAESANISTDSIIGTHGADETYPIVGLASIVAKEQRESHITELQNKYEEYTIGSGYPSDTTTRDFLSEYYRNNKQFPLETRLSWSTCEDIRKSTN